MSVDKKKLQDACTLILEAIGEDTKREGVLDTPSRFANAWEEITEGYRTSDEKITTIFEGENYDEMILVKEIQFHSLCEHHMLPFTGVAHVAYIPNKKIIGLSKIPRIVNKFSKRLQNQERLTMEIADKLENLLGAKGVAVKISASHMCMQMRGVRKENAQMETIAVRGLFRSDSRTRNEFLQSVK